MKLIFLDIDGVLNGHEFDVDVMCGQIHSDKVVRLNQILQVTGASIVLSSAWRYIVHRGEATLQGMDWLLRSHGIFANRLIGITREDTMVRGPYQGTPESWPMTNERGDQIVDWITTNGFEGCCVAIDDLDLGISERGIPLVQTNGKIGLTDADVDRAITLLESVKNQEVA